ncbi:MAG: hypothetical protein FJ276_24495 [Planctomycetes bacterium]|nr:hypothetical protein [Planctomycetota bacterium]
MGLFKSIAKAIESGRIEARNEAGRYDREAATLKASNSEYAKMADEHYSIAEQARRSGDMEMYQREVNRAQEAEQAVHNATRAFLSRNT